MLLIFFLFFFNDPATTEIYTLSLHDALPISQSQPQGDAEHPHSRAARSAQSRSPVARLRPQDGRTPRRSEEHTSELQSRSDLVCRLLLEKKKKKNKTTNTNNKQQ